MKFFKLLSFLIIAYSVNSGNSNSHVSAKNSKESNIDSSVEVNQVDDEKFDDSIDWRKLFQAETEMVKERIVYPRLVASSTNDEYVYYSPLNASEIVLRRKKNDNDIDF